MPPASDVHAVRNPRVVAALARALDEGSRPALAELVDRLERESGLPGPKPSLDLARAVALEVAARGPAGDVVVRALLTSDREFSRIVASLILAERWARGRDPKGALQAIHDLAGDPRRPARAAAAMALRAMLASDGERLLGDLAAFTDGFLHASVALESLADREVLARLAPAHGPAVLARLDEAFTLADESSRAAERLQGVRELRGGLPAQITRLATRFPEVLAWLEDKAKLGRLETREVVRAAVAALRKAGFSASAAARLRDALEASEPPPRDPARIVHGTRRRGRPR